MSVFDLLTVFAGFRKRRHGLCSDRGVFFSFSSSSPCRASHPHHHINIKIDIISINQSRTITPRQAEANSRLHSPPQPRTNPTSIHLHRIPIPQQLPVVLPHACHAAARPPPIVLSLLVARSLSPHTSVHPPSMSRWKEENKATQVSAFRPGSCIDPTTLDPRPGGIRRTRRDYVCVCVVRGSTFFPCVARTAWSMYVACGVGCRRSESDSDHGRRVHLGSRVGWMYGYWLSLGEWWVGRCDGWKRTARYV
jgi:hypothetical protein